MNYRSDLTVYGVERVNFNAPRRNSDGHGNPFFVQRIEVFGADGEKQFEISFHLGETLNKKLEALHQQGQALQPVSSNPEVAA